MDQHDQLLRYTPLPNLTDSSGGAMACTRTLPERTMPKADGMECAADPTEEQHRPDQSALETAPSLRHEATSPPHVEADDMEWDAARTHRPQGQAIHAPAKAFAPPLEAPTPPCLGDDEETETESDMDEDDAPAASLSRSKAAKAEATQDRAPTRDRKNQAYHARRKASRAAAKQKRDASAQSEGEQMEDGEAEPQQACQLWLLMELVRELQTPTQNATTTQEIYSQETEEEHPQMEVTETAAEPKEEQETEEEQSQMEVTEADAEPEAGQEEADQMRDTDERRARHQPTREQRANYPPGYENWSSSKRGNWRRRRKH